MKRSIRLPVAVVIGVCHLVVPAPAQASPVADPKGDAPDPATDLVALDLHVSGSGLEITIETAAAYAFPNTQILLDTDRKAATGFSLAGRGCDVLIEGDNVFSFQGPDPTQWSWKQTGTVRRTVNGNRLAVVVPSAVYNGADCDMIVRTLSPAYAEVDRLPDTGAVPVEVKPATSAPAATSQRADVPEAAGDAAEAARDLIAVTLAQQGGRVVVEAETRAAGGFDQLLVLFDTDTKAETGFLSPSALGLGADVLLSGGRVLRFRGAAQNAWTWEAVQDAAVKLDGARYHADFDAGLLGTAHARAVFMIMSADWQTAVDVAPNQGAFDLRIDTSKVTPPPPPPPPAAPRANRDLPPRARLAQAQSFYCYYGSGQVAALSHADLVVAHAPQMRREDIAALKKLGVVVVGYLTVGEDDELRQADGSGPGGFASWYLDENHDGQPDQNGIWKSYYANANDPAWRADRVREARRLVGEDGYDGIFLDTLDTATAFPATAPGMVQLIEGLRAALPEAPIVLNQGFPMLERLAPSADGLMIESFTATYDFQTRSYVLHTPSSLDWTRGVAERIRPLVERHHLKVLVLDYALPADRERIQLAADRAATFGYLFAAAPITLDAVYDMNIRGRPDPKWLAKQATPDTLRYTLPAPANGFPAATVLVPSGCYGGYRVAPLVDGIRERDKLYWADAGWASAEDGDEAWLELRFPEPLSAGTLRLQWAVDNGRLHASRQYRVEVRRGSDWEVVDRVENNTQAVTEHALPATPFEALRICQPPHGGSERRPDLMWLAQVERRVGA